MVLVQLDFKVHGFMANAARLMGTSVILCVRRVFGFFEGAVHTERTAKRPVFCPPVLYSTRAGPLRPAL